MSTESPQLDALPPKFAATAGALHRVAEQVLAPAQPGDEIALMATPGGFGTPVFDQDGARQQVRVAGTDLVHRSGDEERRTPLDGVDHASANALAAWYAFGAEVLARLDASATARLWPEHFDIAIDLGQATYGFSPGDEHHAEPYAYVGPWTEPEGDLWQATGFRGAELTYTDLLAAPDPEAAALDFFTTRRKALG